MANTIQLKRSAVASKVPLTTDLALGELAINTYDGKMYIKKNNGTESIVSIGGDSLPDQTGNSGKFLSTDGSSTYWDNIPASGGAPTGNAYTIQYNNGDGTFAGLTNVVGRSSGDLELLASSNPSAPQSNNSVVIYKSTFPYPSMSIKHPAHGIGSAADCLIQAGIGSKDIGWWNPPGNATTVPGVLGIIAPTANGTVTARTTSSLTAVTRTRRLGYVTAATVNTSCGQSWTARQWTFGTGSGLGGFYMVYRFAVSDVALVSTGRMTFVGMTGQSGVLGALPTIHCFGLIQAAGGTNYKMRCAGGTLGTDVDLGANFPVDLASVYEVRLFSSPNDSSQVHYEVTRLNTGDTAIGSFSTSLLSWDTSQLLAPQAWRNTGATQATAVALDVISLYIEKTV